MTPRSQLVVAVLVIVMALPAGALVSCRESMIATGKNHTDSYVAGRRSSQVSVISSIADRNQCCELSNAERRPGLPLQSSTTPAVGTPAILVFFGLNAPAIAERTKRVESPRASSPSQPLLCTFLI